VAQVKEPSTLRGWIMQVARSIALDQLRRLHRQRKHAALNHEAIDVPVHDASFELRVALHRTHSVLGRLPRNERDIFAMRHIDGLELGTLATLCGVSLATVKRRLTRAEGRFYALARREPALADWLSA
jgi:RNA polymerase sigma-70 factor (ECF subfamily)